MTGGATSRARECQESCHFGRKQTQDSEHLDSDICVEQKGRLHNLQLKIQAWYMKTSELEINILGINIIFEYERQ